MRRMEKRRERERRDNRRGEKEKWKSGAKIFAPM